MQNNDYDAKLEDWILCLVPRRKKVFLAGRVTGDRNGRFQDGTYITTSLVMSLVDAIIDGNIVQTLNSRYLLADRYQLDDAIFAKLDGWLAIQPEPPSLDDFIATADIDLLAAFILRAFRAAAAEAVWQRDNE